MLRELFEQSTVTVSNLTLKFFEQIQGDMCMKRHRQSRGNIKATGLQELTMFPSCNKRLSFPDTD